MRHAPRARDVLREIPIDELITRRYRVAQVSEAFTALEKGEVARGVITF